MKEKLIYLLVTIDALPISLAPIERFITFLKKLFSIDEKSYFLGYVKKEIEEYRSRYEQKIISSTQHGRFMQCEKIDFSPKKPVKGVHKAEVETPNKLQFVFISIDPENLQGTIDAIDNYMDFVDHYIIVTNNEAIEKMKQITSIHPIELIDEIIILPEDTATFSKRDHQSKNWILRASLLNLEKLQEQFIMLDDDNRPLEPITIEHFIEGGKYNAYYFYALAQWYPHDTEYDMGQHYTKEILCKEGLEQYSYSSHKPQIIDKSIFGEVVERYKEIGLRYPIDEWSIYFNYAVSHYPHLFIKKVFDVMNWPDHPQRWEWMYIPKKYSFENYYRDLYQNGLFSGKPNLSTEEKILLKEKEIAPFKREMKRYGITAQLNSRLQNQIKKMKMIYNGIYFAKDDLRLILCGLPYYSEAVNGAWLRIPLKYSLLSSRDHIIQLVYRLNGDLWYSSTLHISATPLLYGFTSLDIDLKQVPAGPYLLQLDIEIDGGAIFGDNSPYLTRLRVY